MYSRRENSDVAYPFVETRNALRCVVDCYLTAGRLGSEGRTSFPAITKDYYAGITGVSVSHEALFSFILLFPGGETSVSLRVPKDSGVVRVAPSQPGVDGALVVNTNALPTGVTNFDPPVELEPARTCWQTDEITGVKLLNEWRTPDVTARETGMGSAELAERVEALEAANPSRVYSDPSYFEGDDDFMPLREMVSLDGGGIIGLKDGDNCSVTYDPSTTTLTFRGVPGTGAGLPAVDDVPWDEAPEIRAADTAGGIKSLNGVTGENVEIRMSESVLASYSRGRVALNVSNLIVGDLFG